MSHARCNQTAIELSVRGDRLSKLLAEAADWLCPHMEAVELWNKNKIGRVWCCDCHNYIRSDEDATLVDRIREALSREETAK